MKQHVIVLIDISYSMKKNSNAIVNGLNSFVDSLRQKRNSNDTYISVILFCDKIHYMCKFSHIKDVDHFSINQLPEFGLTFLYDAVGSILTEMIPEKRFQHTFFIITDGVDTGSTVMQESDAKSLCDEAIKNGWRITHCGVDAGNLGASVSDVHMNIDELENLISGLSI